MKKLIAFFTPKDSFLENEWILKHQIFAMLILNFFFGLGIFPFAYVRLSQGNLLVGISQLLFGIFLLYSFFILRKKKIYYTSYAIMFFIFFFSYTAIIFFNVPQNKLNILWVISAPILIFFFLNKKAGVYMFVLVLCFIFYLIFSKYPYSLAEYITLIGAFFTTTFIMYIYEKVKEAENNRLSSYNIRLQSEIEKKTKKLKQLNISLEVRVEEELEKRLEQENMLLRQCRMASMGEMIDSIAHQWRQPLMNINAILMNLDRGIEIGKESAYLKEKILEVFSLTGHMSHTIEDFRNLLKEEKEKEKFLVEDMISNILSLIKNNLKGIEMIYTIEESVEIRSYQNELSQVLIVLLSNAYGVLNIKNIEDKKIYITLKNKGNYAVMMIEDNGGGIEEKNLEKIFDPYFTTKNQTGGTGLGLYIAKIIINHHIEGNLNVVNTKKGALFTIEIPL